MNPETLERYARLEVPRYTSYPTAPHFTPAVDESVYRGWLAVTGDAPLSLYLHVPFCQSMCWYCGCHTTVTSRADPVIRYLAALTREISMVAEALPARMKAGFIHFGGGTPTLMSPKQFTKMMAHLRSSFDMTGAAEIAIEIDPRTLEPNMAAALAEAGVNRASLGVQSFDHEVQVAINRIQSFETTAIAVERLRRNGISRINFDLIYGLPGQSVASCLDTVDKAIALAPDRVAVFGYAHVPRFKLHQRRIDETRLPGPSDRLEQSRLIAETLCDAGYRQIGLDHFARPDDPLAEAAATGNLHRNFQGYTTDGCAELIGFGASSIGRLQGGLVQNRVPIPDYQKAVSDGRLPVGRGYALSPEDRLRASVIERLMCEAQVDLDDLCVPYGVDPTSLIDPHRLEPLVADGLVDRDGNRITIMPEARILVRAVAAAFDSYLGPNPARHACAV